MDANANNNNNNNNNSNNNNNNNNTSGNPAQVIVPKENSNSAAANPPPPAYSPRTHADLTTLAARVMQARRGNLAAALQQRPVYTTVMPETAEEEQEEAVDSSPITLRITTAINVSHNNNLVCMTTSPADQANAIAKAVVQAIQENSSGQCGIPMIDEQGCPRPLKIEVDAGMHVEGSGNVVGSREVISEVLRQRGQPSQLRRQREETEEEASGAPAKRRRSSQ